MANKKKRAKYESASHLSKKQISSEMVYQTVYNYYRSRPDLYVLSDHGYISALDESDMVQPVVAEGRLSSRRSVQLQSFTDYWRTDDGYRSYLGRVTIDEGQMVNMTLE